MSRLAAEREKARRTRERETYAEAWARVHGEVPPHWSGDGGILARFDAYEAARRANPNGPTTRIVVSAPPGFTKSTLGQLLAARSIARGLPVMLLSYSGTLAKRHSAITQRLYQTHWAGKIDRNQRSPGYWITERAWMRASGLGGSATGFRAPVVIVDDHTSSRSEAESVAHRERTLDAVKATARTRVEPGGLVAIISTRWHPADASGWALAHGYEHFSVRALDANDESTWPARFSTAELHNVRGEIGDRDWQALYMSEPADSTTHLFADVHLVRDLDLARVRSISLGLDLAYSEKTSADWSIAVALGILDDGTAVVLEVLRRQSAFGALVPELASFQARHGGGAFRWFGGGQEHVIAETLRREGVRVDHQPARVDKISRAQRTAAAWNAGKIGVLAGKPWTDRFVAVVTAFGPGARRDDDVDALVAAHSRVSGTPWLARSRALSIEEAIAREAERRGRAIHGTLPSAEAAWHLV